MSSDAAIRVSNVSKSFPVYEKAHHRLLQMLSPGPKKRWYREFHALRNVDFSIGRGETVGIVGRNGSGKSTLLQLICGTLSPTVGQISTHGRIAALLELGAGFNPEFTGRENVYLNGTVLGLTRIEIDQKFDEIVNFADIGDFVEQPVKNYSSGMYVRLAFAVAINVTPDILIVDEALSVGDEAFQRKCFARIERIRDAGATVLFVSHSASTVLEICDRAILLDQGEVLTSGKPRDVISQYQKLIYSPAEKAPDVRATIKSGGGIAKISLLKNEIVDDSKSVDQASGLVAAETCERTAVADSPAYWEEGLEPVSTVNYERQGAAISLPFVVDQEGRRVNVLNAGETYYYTYQVDFERTVANVRMGMMIKTVTGIEVGGAATASPEDALPVVDAGSSFQVRFRFACLMAPGTYFLSAGVLGQVGEGEDYLDRRIDVAMFRVRPWNARLTTGLVGLVSESSVAPL